MIKDDIGKYVSDLIGEVVASCPLLTKLHSIEKLSYDERVKSIIKVKENIKENFDSNLDLLITVIGRICKFEEVSSKEQGAIKANLP